MIGAVKALIILGVFLLLAYPLLPLPVKLKRFSTSHALTYKHPDNRKNTPFMLVAMLVTVLVAVLLGLFDWLVDLLYAIPFIGSLFEDTIDGLDARVDFVAFAIKMVIVNVVILYAFLILKAFVKALILDPAFGIAKLKRLARRKRRKERRRKKRLGLFKRRKKSDQEDETEQTEEKTEQELEEEREIERRRKRLRVPDFIHTESDSEEEKTESPDEDADDTDGDEAEPEEEKVPKKTRSEFSKWIIGLFFEGDDFEYVQCWVYRLRMVLQIFVYFLEAVYGILVISVLSSVFFPAADWVYTLLIDILNIRLWYVYPAATIVFLQEVCNIFKAPTYAEAILSDPELVEKREQECREARLRALQGELKRRFDSEHVLRYYPESVPSDISEYECTSLPYASSLEYIKKQMELTSGKVVQSYMKCLDSIFNDDHVYFAASFYSELGEYLIAYTYIRLLSGARVIFVVSDPDERASLKKYISDRLMNMTGSSSGCSWRVYMRDERLDQADVFIASPEDFADDNIVEQYPGFFEEACNAVFIDADRTIALESYLCLVMANRLQRATGGRIRFVFLTLDIVKGFAGGSLPKFFGVDKVLSFSSAEENEAVSYTLWNRESKNHRIYSKSGQKPTAIECIIAEQARKYDVDGVRVITEAPLDHAEEKMLAMQKVEINKLYKGVADINYMIYSDERCNLSAALYACTRFRGRKKSAVHIISKPYLLREYFMAKINSEDYINRSSFIQARVAEHADRYKMSLLRIFCDATAERGLSLSEFEKRMKTVILDARERGTIVKSSYCREIVKNGNLNALKTSELAAFLIAGLYDREEGIDTDGKGITSNKRFKAKDYYLIVDPAKQDGYSLSREKYIVFNRVKEIFDRLFECNRRVELILNDRVIGKLDTFPSRVHLEYIAGQSIVYKNSEYEIEHIAKDGSAIYLRRENINFKNCLDTVLLRRYEMRSLEQMRPAGVLNSSQSMLSEITVTPYKASFIGETYGFYSLMTDRQTLDFYRGVEGNPHVKDPHVRNFNESPVIKVAFKTKTECTDGMRMLMTAAFNEFVRTIFPSTYHCIAICPVLAEPLPYNSEVEPESEIERIKALYPYLKNPTEDYIETDPYRMQFYFINDCVEDIGILDWFYDRSARYMQEFLANIYSYLYWLRRRANRSHYIYFGGEALPECYDLEGCCELLKDYNLVLSDDGKKDYDTAGDDVEDEETRRCSFCHSVMESGRFQFFDKNRFICSECFDIVDSVDRLEEIYDNVRDYMEKAYPEVKINTCKVKLDKVNNITETPVLSEHLYSVDLSERAVLVERDNPVRNVEVSILRGLITLWQNDNNLIISHAAAQLYFEELVYLKSIKEEERAKWIYDALDADTKSKIDEIATFVYGKAKLFDTPDKPEPPKDDKNNEPTPDPIPEKAEEPVAAEDPEAAEEPEAVEEPVEAEEPEAAEESVEAEEPEAVEEPEAAEEPVAAEDPIAAEEPAVVEETVEETPETVEAEAAEEAAEEATEEKVETAETVEEEKAEESFTEASSDKLPGNENACPPDSDEEEEEESEEDEEEEAEEGSEPVDPALKTSFFFMQVKAKELEREYNDEPDSSEEYCDDLYDPNTIPRFWKRYLKGESADDGKEDELPEAVGEGVPDDEAAEDNEEEAPEGDSPEKEERLSDMLFNENAPFGLFGKKNSKKNKDSDSDFGFDVEDMDTDNESSTATEEKPEEPSFKDLVDGEPTEAEPAEKPEETPEETPEEPVEEKPAELIEELPEVSDDEVPALDINDPFLSKKERKKLEKQLKKEEKEKAKQEKKDKKAEKKAAKKNKKGGEEPAETPEGTEPAEGTDTLPEAKDKKTLKAEKKAEKKAAKLAEKEAKSKAKQDKKGKKSKKPSRKGSEGERIAPHEEDEDTNPSIRVYNEFVRRAFDYSEEPFSREGVSDKELERAFIYVKCDYPELFWLGTYSYTPDMVAHKFRCRDANDRLDVKQIKKDREALRKAAKPFIKGITKKTDPYKAALMIYRRVILAFDYDDVGLAAGVDKDVTKEDRLRSLKSALIDHKVVCAGYAAAMQYLLQSVGIVSGYVCSEIAPLGDGHAFNVLKIGKYCYYLDATWGDSSKVSQGKSNGDDIRYDYFCVPYDEFVKADKNSVAYHCPRAEYYPNLKPFNYTNHEYYRYHNAYLRRYDENEITRIFADAAANYDEKEMGRFSVSFRCCNAELLKCVVTSLAKGKIHAVIKNAKKQVGQTKKNAVKCLEYKLGGYYYDENTCVAYFNFDNPDKKEKKSKKKSK